MINSQISIYMVFRADNHHKNKQKPLNMNEEEKWAYDRDPGRRLRYRPDACDTSGPITFEVLRRGITKGFLPALQIDIGAIAADAVFFVVIAFGLAQVVNNTTVKIAIWIGGCALLCFLGLRGIYGALSNKATYRDRERHCKKRDGSVTGRLFNMHDQPVCHYVVGGRVRRRHGRLACEQPVDGTVTNVLRHSARVLPLVCGDRIYQRQRKAIV